MEKDFKEIDYVILGYLLSEKNQMLKVIDKVHDKYLAPEYREFYSIIKRCAKKYNTLPTIRMVTEDESWREEYTQLYESCKTYKNNEDYEAVNLDLDVNKLKERYNTNELLKFGRDVFKQNLCNGKFQDLEDANLKLRKLVAEVDSIKAAKTYKEGSLKSTAREARENYLTIKTNPALARGIKFGFQELDRITNGLQPSELVLIGGESSAGKSALAMNMAINAWLGSNPYPEDMAAVEAGNYADDGANVMYFTIEMPFNPLRRRVDSCLAGVPLYGLRDGRLTETEERQYEACLKFQENYSKEFYIVDIPRGCTIAQIEAKYMEMLYEFQPQLIVVDYISLMKLDNDESQDWLNVGHLAEMLHEFARTYEVPCITPVQLNRPKQGTQALPDQHRVGRSIMLPQNCNIMLNIDTRPDENTQSNMVINIAKMRDGEKGSLTLHKRLDIMRITDDIAGWTVGDYEIQE